MVHTSEEANGLIEVKFEIYESDGYLCASGVGTSIHTWARNWNKLMKNIKDAIELYYNMPPKTEFKLLLEAWVNHCAEAAFTYDNQ